jgi:hypothetical protein
VARYCLPSFDAIAVISAAPGPTRHRISVCPQPARHVPEVLPQSVMGICGPFSQVSLRRGRMAAQTWGYAS